MMGTIKISKIFKQFENTLYMQFESVKLVEISILVLHDNLQHNTKYFGQI